MRASNVVILVLAVFAATPALAVPLSYVVAFLAINALS
jgi:hypothetical protein